MHMYKSTDRFAALLPRTSLPCFTRKICRWQSVNSKAGAEPRGRARDSPERTRRRVAAQGGYREASREAPPSPAPRRSGRAAKRERNGIPPCLGTTEPPKM